MPAYRKQNIPMREMCLKINSFDSFCCDVTHIVHLKLLLQLYLLTVITPCDGNLIICQLVDYFSTYNMFNFQNEKCALHDIHWVVLNFQTDQT